jgi:hypothetical protein
MQASFKFFGWVTANSCHASTYIDKQLSIMALYRRPPTCPECGEEIRGKYTQHQTFFVGDTFQKWDWENHKCRLGTKYFIERMDTHNWWVTLSLWTNDPMKATMFDTKEEAEEFLKTTNHISARIDAQVTEHEFVREQPAREPNLKDALAGFRKKR